MSATELEQDPASLADAIAREFETARMALQTVGSLAQQLERAASAAAAASVPKLVRVKTITPTDRTGRPVRRGPGRPRGHRNHVTLLATPKQIEELRAQLRK